MNNRRAKIFLEKYVSHFILRFVCERKLETEQRLQHIDLTSPSGHSRVSFSFSWAQPEDQGLSFLLSAGFLYHILSPTGLQNSLGIPRTPSTGCGFPYHILSLTHLISNSLTSCLPPSHIIVQSPTQSLEWHVWSSSSENNCHAVQRLLSSGASVSQICLRDFFRLLVIGMCHFLPVHQFGMACWPGRRSKYNNWNLFTLYKWMNSVEANN